MLREGVNKLSNKTSGLFYSKMEDYMIKEYNISVSEARKLVNKYKEGIEVNEISQQLGYDYFSIQILMEEKYIPYKPI